MARLVGSGVMHLATPNATPPIEGNTMSKLYRYGGIAASVVLIVFGIASIVIGAAGRNTVQNNLAAEKITGTPDMTPKAIKAEAQGAGLKNVDLPTCSVAGKAVDNGANARCFAQYMRIHALEASEGTSMTADARGLTSGARGERRAATLRGVR
jgi:hypothetical protein